MTDITYNTKKINIFQIVFTLCVVTAFLISLFGGTTIPVSVNCIILPTPALNNEPFWKMIAQICCFDTLMLWILSLPLNKTLRTALSSVVFSIRGLIIGCALKIMLGNSVDWVTVLMFVSYCIVTLLASIYDMFLNASEEKGALCRFLAYFACTGASAMIRLIPFVLLMIIK